MPKRAKRKASLVSDIARLTALWIGLLAAGVAAPAAMAILPGASSDPAISVWRQGSVFFPPGALIAVAALLGCSAFFSGSETALFSIHRLRLRALREEQSFTGRLVVQLLDDPGRLLTTILVGNVLVNVLIGAIVGTRVEGFLEAVTAWPAFASYVGATLILTAILLFFGDILPKVVAVHAPERFARAVVVPLEAVRWMLTPLCGMLLRLTDLLFKVVRFHEFRAAPFITDDELRSVLSDSEAHGVLEEEERQMIEGILEFSDVLVREILVPRPSVIAIEEDADIEKALDILREHDCSRLPVYREDLDHIVGLLVAKDMLPHMTEGKKGCPIRPLLRPVHFVPETMTVRQFVRDAQRHRTHMAVVVDEYGGTSGIVTLHDAIQEVVGDILDAGDEESFDYVQLDANTYRVAGNLPVDELSELVGVEFEDAEHTTVAGLLMNIAEKLPDPGDSVTWLGMRFTVESCEGKRVSIVRVERLQGPGAAEGETPAERVP